MESAYDHIQEETLPDQTPTSTDPSSTQSQSNLNTELQDAYNSFSSSAWGARIGGFLATAKKQGETYIQEGRNQATSVGGEAIKGFTDLRTTLVSRARSMSQGEAPSSPPPTKTGEDETKGKEKVPSSTEASEKDENNPESAGFISRFKTTAEQGLRDLQRAEDAADEALLKFGGNIRSFLRDAVTIAPPSTGDTPGQRPGQILFESKDHEGKRVIHTTRFDAQLHVVHCSLDSFLKDPVSPEWEGWSEGFDVGGKTEDIARDLERYEELRRSMERCVPERVEYARFWMRYYFLRMVVESEERRRKEILKGAAQNEEVAWDEDSDEEPSTPHAKGSVSDLKAEKKVDSDNDTLKVAEPRKSEDKSSQAGSDASYDLVSGTQSRAPGSPKEEKGKKKDDSDDEDWE